MQSRGSHSKLRMTERVGWRVKRVRLLTKWKGRKSERTVTNWLKSGLLSFIHLKCKSVEADTEHTQLSPFLSHLHWKDCRVCVKAEAHELHGTVWAPLSQFLLPHVGEHVRAVSKGKANSTHYPHSYFWQQGIDGNLNKYARIVYVNVLHGVLPSFSLPACIDGLGEFMRFKSQWNM